MRFLYLFPQIERPITLTIDKCFMRFYTTAKILIFRRILLSRWRRRRPNTFSFRTLTLVKVNRNR